MREAARLRNGELHIQSTIETPKGGGIDRIGQVQRELKRNFAEQDARFARAFAILEEGVAQHAFPGAAVSAVFRDELVALRGVGRFTYEADAPDVRPDTIYDLASVTKVVATTTMAMLLYERGKLSLDAQVVGLIPEFARHEPQRGSVTVRQLLTHSSGLPPYMRLFESYGNRKDLIGSALQAPLNGIPGTNAAYSDIGFIVLGEILKRVAEEPIDTFCEREVFQPLGMTSTCFRPSKSTWKSIPPTEDDKTFRHRIIQGEVNDENASVMGGVAGHAGLFAPAEDLARFAYCMLSGGAPILRRETIELFTRRQTSPAGTSHALGWDTPSQPSQSGRYFSPRSYGHLGFTGTSLWIDPERELAVALLTNRTWPDRNSPAIKQIRPRFHDAVAEGLR